MKAYNSEDFLSKLNRIIIYDKEEKINGIMDFDALEKLYISIYINTFNRENGPIKEINIWMIVIYMYSLKDFPKFRNSFFIDVNIAANGFLPV